MGDILHEPNLWHINRHAVSKAFMVGIFCCFMPIPLQMLLAAFVAVWVNSNLPISVMLVWISNPFTMPPIFYLNYVVGAFILRTPTIDFDLQLSLTWLTEKMVEVGIPLYLGSFVCGLFFSVIAYMVIEYLWRRKIRKQWARRKAKRAKIHQQAPQS